MSKNERMAENIMNAWHKIVLDPPMQFIDLLAAETKKTAGVRPSEQDVKNFIRTKIGYPSEHEQSPPSDTRNIPNRIVHVHTNRKDKYTGTKPIWFSLGGEDRTVKSWKEMVVKVCEIAASQNKDTFEKGTWLIKGAGGRDEDRCYFATSQGSEDYLRKGKQVPGTGLHVETNLSANNAKSLCDAISNVFDYGKEIRVKLWE